MSVEFRFGAQRVAINMPDWPSLKGVVEERLRNAEGFAVATLNLDHLTKLPHDPEFLDAYAAIDLVVADGNPVVWLSQLAGRPVELQPGSDLVVPMVRLAADAGCAVALVGSRDEVLEEAKRALLRAVPDVQVVLTHAPPYGFDPEGPQARQIMADLVAADVRLCILALGSVTQERFAIFGRTVAPKVGFGCFGAGLDFLGGHQRRAPRWVRQIKMEWLWRMVGHPIRLGARYARCLTILPHQVKAAWRMRKT